MVTDIILENQQEDRRIIIDTKFTNILARSQFGDGQRFKTGHIYQLYSYLRSQERDDDPRSLNSEGMLLYPAIGFDVDESGRASGAPCPFCDHRPRRANENSCGEACVSCRLLAVSDKGPPDGNARRPACSDVPRPGR